MYQNSPLLYQRKIERVSDLFPRKTVLDPVY
jgi:hypothetical protein